MGHNRATDEWDMIIADQAVKTVYATFEDLDLYKEARAFRVSIYRVAKQLPEEEKFNLRLQMRRAAVSLTNNIAEGHGRFHYQENIQFLRQARGSLQELIDDLNVCLDERYADADDVIQLKGIGYALLKRINGHNKYLQREKLTIT